MVIAFYFTLLPIIASKDFSNWIGDHIDKIGPKTLKEITLPGTHDSGTYNLTTKVMPDSEPWLLEVCTEVGEALLRPVDEIVQDWTRTQDEDFYSQMLGGIRYFDLRAGWFNETKEWVTFHMVIGNPVSELLSNISLFLSEHPKEIVIVEISHLDGSPSEQEIDGLKDLVVKSLGEFLHPVDLSFGFSVEKMIETGKRALVSISEGDYQVFNIWPESTIHNTYADSDVVKTMMEYNKNEVEKYENSTWPNELFKVSWTLTASTETVLDSVFPWEIGSLIELADSCNVYLTQFWMNIKLKGYRAGNILIIDHYESSSIIQVVLDMNGLLDQVVSY